MCDDCFELRKAALAEKMNLWRFDSPDLYQVHSKNYNKSTGSQKWWGVCVAQVMECLKALSSRANGKEMCCRNFQGSGFVMDT